VTALSVPELAPTTVRCTSTNARLEFLTGNPSKKAYFGCPAQNLDQFRLLNMLGLLIVKYVDRPPKNRYLGAGRLVGKSALFALPQTDRRLPQ